MMAFTVIKILCILMAIFAVVTLFQSKIKLLGKILGSIIAILIAVASNESNWGTEGMYILVNLVMLFTTINFRMKIKKRK